MINITFWNRAMCPPVLLLGARAAVAAPALTRFQSTPTKTDRTLGGVAHDQEAAKYNGDRQVTL